MPDRPEKVCLVIPCFNERERLAESWEAFRQAPHELLFVSDGSTDETTGWIQSNRRPHMHLLELSRNTGKAEAVRQGMLHVQTLPFYPQLTWVGYWDADLSAPLAEVETMLRYNQVSGGNARTICGSRIYKLGSQIHRSYKRHVLGRLFATLVGFLFPRLHVYDSQCGAKLFRREMIQSTFSEPFVSRWLFDIEILLRLQDSPVTECPLQRWQEKPGSKMRIHSNVLNVFCDLYRLKRIYAHP